MSFPVTYFTKEYGFDKAHFREHISWLLEYKPAGLFPACGGGSKASDVGNRGARAKA